MNSVIGRSDTSRKSVAEIELGSNVHEERYSIVEQNDQNLQESPKTVPHRTIDEFLDAAYEASGQNFSWRFWLIFIAMGMGNFGDAVELASMGYLLSDDGFESEILNHDMKHNASILTSVAPAGMIIGGLLAGAFENYLGRKKVVLFGILVNAASCLASAFAPHVRLLAFFRFIAGLGIGAFYSSLIPLSTELSPRTRRGLCVTLVSSFWPIGTLYLNGLAYVVLGIENSSWRVFIGMTSIPTLIAFVSILFLVPESTRSLALMGDFDGAAKSANRMAQGLQYTGEYLSSEEIRHQFDQISAEKDTGAFQGAAENLKMLYSPSLWKKTLTVHMIWIFCEMAGSTGAWLNTVFVYDGANEFLGSFFLAIGGMVGAALGATVMDTVGRQWTLTGSLAILAISSVMLALAVYSDAVHLFITMAGAFLWSVSLSVAWSANSVITGEVFPTQVRGSAGGLAAAVGRTALIIVQFANGSIADQPVSLLLFGSAVSTVGAIATKVCHPKEMAQLPLEDVVSNDSSVAALHRSNERQTITARNYKKINSGIQDNLHLNDEASVQPESEKNSSLGVGVV